MGKNENLEMKRILDISKSKITIIACILIMFIILGYIYSYHYKVPEYRSTATLLLIPNTISENKLVTNLELAINSELINTYSSLAKNPKIIRQTIQNLGLNMTEKELLNKMKVNIVENTYIIEIAISNIDAQKAMDITNELSNVFLEEIRDIYNLNNLGVVDKAELAQLPYNMNHIKDMIIFLGMGVMVSFIYVMIIYIFDNTLKKEEDIENYMNLRNLGSIPIYQDKKQEIIDTNNVKSYIAECMNTIRTNILYMNSAKNAKTILITSCMPQEGKSWISANIAASFAKINKKVLLIDGDMRKGRAHKIFKVSNKRGLSNYLHVMTGDIERNIKLGKNFIKETRIPNLHILTNGKVPANPSELLGSNNMKQLIKILKNVYDIIIVDAPPCKLVTDSILLSAIMDSTILVVNSEKTKMNDLKEVKKSIEVVGGQIIGSILNKKKVTVKAYKENYYYDHIEKKDLNNRKEEEIISVTRVLKRALLKLERKGFKMDSEENKQKKIENTKNNTDEVIDKVQKMFEEKFAQMDYTEQIMQIKDMLTNLNDSYLELANNIKEKNKKVEETSSIENKQSKNIISFKAFKG